MTDSKPTKNEAKANGEAQPTDVFTAEGAATATETPDLATVIAERDEYLDQLQRSRAEFVNYRRRTEQERAAIREIAGQALLAQLVPVLDDLQRALAAVPEEEAQAPFVQGVRLVERKFWNVLERAGVTPLEAIGQPFDPSLHEAVEMVPGTAADTVVDVYQPGYRLGSTLLRPAMVKVGPADAAPPAASASGTKRPPRSRSHTNDEQG